MATNEFSLIALILGSSLLSAIVTSTMKIMMDKKNTSAQFITNERKEWRNEIRDLSYLILSYSFI